MKAICCALVLLVACADRAPEQTSTKVEETRATETSAPPPPMVVEEIPTETVATAEPAGERNISIEHVQVANPIVISGRARTFENNVVVRARDAKGALIVEGFTTSTGGGMGEHNPYRATLWLTRDPGNRVIAEALEYSAKDGAEQSLVRVEKPFALESVEARLHFPDANCTGVKPYTRRIPKSISMVRLLIEALMAGPTADEKKRGAEGPFPKGSEVRSVNLRDGVATVDFNERLQNVGGSCAAQMIRASVTETLRALPNVKSVKITAGGSEALALQP